MIQTLTIICALSGIIFLILSCSYLYYEEKHKIKNIGKYLVLIMFIFLSVYSLSIVYLFLMMLIQI